MRRVRISTKTGPQYRQCLAQRNGLALTRAPRGESGWTVTHMATGHRINYLSLFPLRRARVAFALASALGDWGDVIEGDAPDGLVDALRAISAMADA